MQMILNYERRAFDAKIKKFCYEKFEFFLVGFALHNEFASNL